MNTVGPARLRHSAGVIAWLFVSVASSIVVAPTAGAASGPCAPGTGVTVVVNFGDLGRPTEVRCAPGDPDSGFDALSRAGLRSESVIRELGFLCRIDGLPGTDRETCRSTPAASAHWHYWSANPGGTWREYQVGAASSDPAVGSVEGWVFTTAEGQLPSPKAPSPTAPSAPPEAVTVSPPPAAAARGEAPAPTLGVPAAPAPPAPAPAVPAPAPVPGESAPDGGPISVPDSVVTSAATTAPAPAVGERSEGERSEGELAAASTPAGTTGERSTAGSPGATLIGVGAVLVVGAAGWQVRRRSRG